MHQLGLVARRHDDKAWQIGQKAHIEGTGMRGAIGSDQPCAVNRKAHGQALQGHIVHDLVITALQEGGINRHKGL